MKKYDFKRAHDFILKHKESIEEVQMGMAEDWFWTAGTVYKNGDFTMNLLAKGTVIAGIDGSDWATPSALVTLKDGSEVMCDCFIGNSDAPKPVFWKHGALSSSVQEAIEGIKRGVMEE